MDKNTGTIYEATYFATLLYGSGSWTVKAADIHGMQSAGKRYLRRVNGCTRLNNIKRKYIRKELKIQSVQNKVDGYGQNGINHLNRMIGEIIPKQITRCKPNECRNRGRWNECVK
jgi:hypothetical protein